jgi:hypothetical protein
MNSSLPRITQVTALGGHRVKLRFSDGVEGELDLRDDIVGAGGVFAPLEDPDYFAKVKLSRSGGTIEWPNDVDFCPDVLYSRVSGKPLFEDADKVA